MPDLTPEIIVETVVMEVNGPQGPSAASVISATAPVSPNDGDRWLDSDTGIEWTWYEDVDGGQWISSNAPITQAVLEAAITDDPAFRFAIGVEDVNGNLPVQGIILSDSGNVSLDSGVISENSAGSIIRHDGVSDGDDLPYLEYGWRITGYEEITAIQNQAGVIREIGRFSLPAGLATAGARFLVTGSISVEHGSGINTPLYTIAFVPAGITAAAGDGIGFLNNFSSSGSQLFPAFYLVLNLNDNLDSTYTLGADTSLLGVLIEGEDATTATMHLTQSPTPGAFVETGPLAAAQDVVLYYSVAATASAPLSRITVNFTIVPL